MGVLGAFNAFTQRITHALGVCVAFQAELPTAKCTITHYTKGTLTQVCALVRAYINACVLEPTALTLAVNVINPELQAIKC